MGTVTVRLGGLFEVAAADVSGIGSRKARTLLKLLAVQRTRAVPMDLIVDVRWRDDPPRCPEDNVASLVSRLRGRFGPQVVTGGRDGYRLGRPRPYSWIWTSPPRISPTRPGGWPPVSRRRPR